MWYQYKSFNGQINEMGVTEELFVLLMSVVYFECEFIYMPKLLNYRSQNMSDGYW
jgi:hypothetical protein